ncbi:MAG: S41 family peptidase [Pirellulales bacterium]|nr:S41 family peptidase [Pirellulales bacterium]
MLRGWAFCLRISCALILAGLWPSFTASGQVLISAPAASKPGQLAPAPQKLPPPVTAEVEGVLRRGSQLEAEYRWGEALTLYEDALRVYPQQTAIAERLDVTRIHYDLSRRYADSSFRNSLLSLEEAEALELYQQVLARIFAHYVTQPNWTQVVERGTRALGVALYNPGFSDAHLTGRDDQQLRQFLAEARQITQRGARDRTEAVQLVKQIARLGQQRLALSAPSIILEFTCGAIGSLDEYSSFLTNSQLNDLYSQIDGNFVGLGVELKAIGKQLVIVSVIVNSPAERAGLQRGDRISAVDGQSTTTLSTDKAADLLQGIEGSLVTLVIEREGEPARQLQVRREQVEVPSIEQAHILDRSSGTAYCKLTAFQKTTASDLDRALWDLHRQGMKSLIIDLRGNPGGLLTASVEAADRFLEQGTIVSTRGRNPQEDFIYTANKPGTWKVPLVVLIDGDSASASEIFAGAMRDHQRATIIGVRSFGKGSVQGIFPLNVGNTGIRLTTAKFYSPLGKPYSKIGVEPAIEVRAAAKPLLPAESGLTISSPVPTGVILANPTPPAHLQAGQLNANSQAIRLSLRDPGDSAGDEPAAENGPVNANDPVISAALQVTRKNVAAR